MMYRTDTIYAVPNGKRNSSGSGSQSSSSVIYAQGYTRDCIYGTMARNVNGNNKSMPRSRSADTRVRHREQEQREESAPPAQKKGGGFSSWFRSAKSKKEVAASSSHNQQQGNQGGGGGKQAPGNNGRVASKNPVQHKQNSMPTPRRHTVSVAGMDVEHATRIAAKNYESAAEKEQLYDHLVTHYPQHAGKINDSHIFRTVETTSSRHIPPVPESHYATVSRSGQVMEDGDDQLSIKSDMEAGSAFSRGGRLRSSLPIVRSPNKSLDRPLGTVFLIFRNETKRATLPNEITSMDTIRALFVRAFPDQLTMQWFDTRRNPAPPGGGANGGPTPRRRIYIMDPSTSVYYELDDMRSGKLLARDVKDRAVLKIYETDGGGNSPLPSPKPRYHSGPPPAGYESDSSVRSAPTGGLPRSPVHLPPPRPYSQEVASKSASLPPQATYIYGTVVGQPQSIYGTHTVAGGAPNPNAPHGHMQQQQPWNSPTTAHRPHSQYNPSVRSQQASPVRSPSHVQRHSVGYLPAPRGNELYAPLDAVGGRVASGYYDYPTETARSSGSVTPTMESVEQRHRMEKMEAQLANLTSLVQTAVIRDGGPGNSRPPSARSITSLDPVNTSNKSRHLVEESLYAEVTTSSSGGLSDLSTVTPQPLITAEMHRSLVSLRQRAREIRTESTRLRRAQLANTESMRETVHETFIKIKNVLEANPALSDQPVRAQRQLVNKDVQTYKEGSAQTFNNLRDLEAAVEELRSDVVNKKCRVNEKEVEALALNLSTISKSITEMQSHFPDVQASLKPVMSAEMEIVVQEEKLATVMATRSPQAPQLPPPPEHTPDKRPLMDNIQALVPDHNARVSSIEAAENSRERKKKISSHADALRFEKTLEIAAKQLKETNNIVNLENRQQEQWKQIGNNNPGDNGGKNGENGTVNLPLSDTTTSKNDTSQSQVDGNGTKSESPKSKSPPKLESPTKIAPAPPAKPPRSYDHTTSPNGNNNGNKIHEVMIVKSPIVVEHITSVVESAAATMPSPGPILSTFAPTTPQPQSLAAEQPLSLTPVPKPKAKPPMSLATSTPKNSVSFCNTVTEIPPPPAADAGTVAMSPMSTSSDSSSGSAGVGMGGKPKKIPPPPPPRKSSRTVTAKTTAQQNQARPASPPAYENLDTLQQKMQDAASAEFESKIEESKLSPENESPTTKGFRPLTKFQKELASGIYSNMNRPDLQEQNVRPVAIVRSPEHTAKSRLPEPAGSDTDSSTSQEVVQLSGTVRRRTPSTSSKENSPAPQLPANGSAVANKDPRKIPPPPPVRKTSALTDGQVGGTSSPKPNGDAVIVGNGDVVSKMGNGEAGKIKLSTKPLIDKHSLSPASRRKYEETEIY